MYCLHPSGEKLPADAEVIQKYSYKVGDAAPFTGLLIQEEITTGVIESIPTPTVTATINTEPPAY